MPRKSNQDIRYEVITQKDENGDLLIPIPPMLLESLKWKPGDDIQFDLDDKGRYILKKVYK
jgi:bifunctional DNA-binding transcriptional regulator/antitoxin component of YhaV-PrlF toxin-antitoxin module